MLQERIWPLTHLVYEGLVVIDEITALRPAGRAVGEQPRRRNVDLTLKEGITFHDGTPLTAADVAATVTEILRLVTDEASPYRGVFFAALHGIQRQGHV